MRLRPDPAPLLGGVALVALWEAAVRTLNVSPFVLPAPSAVGAALVARFEILAPAALVTVALAGVALALAALFGMSLAFLLRRAPLAERAFGPYAFVLQATPIIAIAPLVVIWAGVDHPRRAIVVLGAIAAFFPVFASTLAGLKAVNPGLDRLFRLYRATPWQRFTRLELPASAPLVLAGLRTAAALSLVSVVAAEFLAGSGATGGLAWRILEAGNRLETAAMFAALALLAGIGIAASALFDALERRFS